MSSIPENQRLDTIREIFEDADIYGYIHNGQAYIDTYDVVADKVLPKLLKDQSISQIQNIIWEEFYKFICTGHIGNTKDRFSISRAEAKLVMGHPEKFKDLAHNIRHTLLGI